MHTYVQLFWGGRATEVGCISLGRKCTCTITVTINFTCYIVHPALLTPNGTDAQHYNTAYAALEMLAYMYNCSVLHAHSAASNITNM